MGVSLMYILCTGIVPILTKFITNWKRKKVSKNFKSFGVESEASANF